MADLIDDQSYTQRFWWTFAQQLSSKYSEVSRAGAVDANWFMPSAQALIANFTAAGGSDDSATTADAASEIANYNLALYDYANRIPQWSVSWTGNQDGNLFDSYKDYVQQLHTNPVLSGRDLANAQKQLANLEGELAAFNDEVGRLKTNFFKEYESENMLDDGTGQKVWLPGFSVATMLRAWNGHKTSAIYKAQLDDIIQSRALDLSGIAGQISQLQNKIYGAGFNALQEAQSDTRKADPDFANSFDDDKARAVFQMQAGSDGWLPKYEAQGGDNAVVLATYKKWLAAAQTALANNEKPKYAFSLQSSALDQQNTDAKLSFNAVVPIEEILMLDVSGSGEYKSAYTQKEDFSLNVSYQDLFLMPVQPGRRWFNESMIKEYGRPQYFTPGSPFAQGPLGGPKGILNLQVNAVMVGVGRSIEFTSQKFKEFDWSESFNASVGVSILGFIHLGGGSVSENHSATSLTTTDTGFVIRDTSGAPSIVGLLVQEIFPADR
jgi:hypothetical protein